MKKQKWKKGNLHCLGNIADSLPRVADSLGIVLMSTVHSGKGSDTV